MHSAFVSNENYRDQSKHHDENDALFVLRQIEDREQALHFFA